MIDNLLWGLFCPYFVFGFSLALGASSWSSYLFYGAGNDVYEAHDWELDGSLLGVSEGGIGRHGI